MDVSDVSVDGDQTKKRESEERRQRRLRRMFPALLFVVFLVYAFTTNLIPSESMQPTLNPGDQILTMRSWLAYFGGRTPSRGDVVVFILPPEKTKDLETDSDEPVHDPGGRKQIGVFREPKGETLIKRVVGLPGETITIQHNHVFADGKQIAEPYKTVPADVNFDSVFPYGGEKPVKLGPTELFVMGDNRNNSEDSRYWGPLPIRYIRGRFISKLFHRDVSDSAPPPAPRPPDPSSTVFPAISPARREK